MPLLINGRLAESGASNGSTGGPKETGMSERFEVGRRLFLAGVAATGFLAGTRQARAAEPLKVQLGWLKNVESAPHFVAVKKGFFAAQGIEATLLAGGPQIDPISQVASGAADVGIATSALAVLAARAQGVPIVVLGCQYQKSALGLAARADRGLTLPASFKGAKIGYQQINRGWLLALLEVNKVDQDDVSLSVVTADPTMLIEGRIELMTVAVLNVPTTMRRRGVEPKTWLAYDLGVPMQGDIIVCRADTLDKKRALIERYLHAVGQGAAYNLAEPDEVARFTTEDFGEGLDLATQLQYNRAQLEFFSTSATKEHGLFWIDKAAWEKSTAAAVATGIIDKPADLGPVLGFDVLGAADLPKV
jgi:ABC-type nitrate/sulfonate/bicarbonate transport system substrate-binding protein